MARLADGWMTTFKSPEEVQTSLAMIREYARELGHELKPDFEVAIYHNINVDEDRDRAFAEAKRFLDSYYSVDYREDMLKAALHDWPRSPAPMTVGGATDRADRLADRARSS